MRTAETRAKHAAWMRRRRRLIAYGRYEPELLVDPDAARAHIQSLRDFGISVRALGNMLGRDGAILAPIVYPNHARYSAQITAKMEASILALRFDLDAIRDGALVLNVGTARRIEALACMGWSANLLAKRLGVGPGAVRSYRSTARSFVRVETARAIRDLYDELSMQQGPARKAADWARARGWLPPLVWDDDSIDDPDAEPAEMYKSRTGTAEHVEDVEWVLTHNPHATLLQVAERLGVERGTLLTALIRAGRDDLRDRLADNAELAGFTVRRRTA